jgi:hypothetical protein
MSCIKMPDRHNGGVKDKLSLLIPCLLVCAAGTLSCSGGSDNSSNDIVDAAVDKNVRADAAALGGGDAGVLRLDAPGMDVPSVEAALPADAEVDQAAIVPDVGAGDAGVIADAATTNGDAPQPILDSGVILGDAGLDNAAKDATGTPATDATQLDAGAPEAKVDGAISSPDAGPDVVANCGRIKCDCTYKGKKLWGRVQYVTIAADFRVRKADFPDLNVAETAFPWKCGQWQTVDIAPDFTVQLVDIAEDFSISKTDASFPGLP